MDVDSRFDESAIGGHIKSSNSVWIHIFDEWWELSYSYWSFRRWQFLSPEMETGELGKVVVPKPVISVIHLRFIHRS